jgi:hypothetical protein
MAHLGDGGMHECPAQLRQARANEVGWLTFDRKYVSYPRSRRRGGLTIRRTTGRQEVTWWQRLSLPKKRSMKAEVNLMTGIIKILREKWNIMDVCNKRPYKHIVEALKSVADFQ